MRVKVTAFYHVDEGEADTDDKSGLTEEAYAVLTDQLMQMGMEEIEVEQVAS